MAFPTQFRGVGDDGCFFLLVFDDGNFNEFETFLISDWMRHVPRDVLAKNFQVNETTFRNLPKEELYIFASDLPRNLTEEKEEVAKGTGYVPSPFAFFTSEMKPNKTMTGGEVKIVDANNFPVTNIAAAIVTLKPGALRELHWHPNADEWQYYVEGNARMGVFKAGGLARTMDFTAGDVGYVEKSTPHYVENTGTTDVVFLEVFPTPTYEDISLAEWMAHTPSRLVNEHIKTGEEFIDSIKKTETVIEPE